MLTDLFTLMAAALALGGASQDDGRFCTPKPEPRRTAMQEYQHMRRIYGLPASRARIRTLIRRDQWSYDHPRFPASPRENRYMRLHDRIHLGARASRYLHARRDLFGGVSIEDGWPRGPYLLVRLTRDRAKHTRALRRIVRYPRHLRTVQVELSERQLDALQDRIDWEAAAADGFDIAATGPDIDANTVDIDLITRRTDHAEYFRARYGPHVRTTVIATEPTSPECAEIYSRRPGPDPASVTVVYESGGDAEFERVEVHETPDRVEIGVIVQVPNGFRTSDSLRAEVTVALSGPLGDRRVVDASTGKMVRR